MILIDLQMNGLRSISVTDHLLILCNLIAVTFFLNNKKMKFLALAVSLLFSFTALVSCQSKCDELSAEECGNDSNCGTCRVRAGLICVDSKIAQSC